MLIRTSISELWLGLLISFYVKKYSLSAYYVPDTVLDTEDMAMNETDKALAFSLNYSLSSRQN